MWLQAKRRSKGGITRHKFRCHQRRACRLGIEFNFTFEEWCAWWEANLGPNWEKLRGHNLGQHVMGRKGDIGPYHPDNVMCITNTINSQMAHVGKIQTADHKLKNSLANRGINNPRVKLTEPQVLEIFKASGTISGMARHYRVSRPTIKGIKVKKIWSHLTEGL